MNTDTTRLQRMATGVSGLDAVLGGGLPELSFSLIAGPPGSGKTTLAHQIMFALASPERPALYFTVLGEPPLKMLRYQQQFEFFEHDRVKDSIRFISLADETASGDLDKVLARISSEVEAHAPGLVFVDSFRSVAGSPARAGIPSLGLQHFIQNLGVLMTCWQATTFLVGEYFTPNDPNPVFTVADGLIWLSQSVQGNSVVRKLEIIKMRGQATVPGLHTFRIGSAGITVFGPPPCSAPLADAGPGLAERLPMGVPGLDGMMGGGLPRGYSLLVAGPSGSGKTLLAEAYLAEGARHGETGVIAAFEQRPRRPRSHRLADLIASGQVGVVDTRAPDLSVDEMAMLLITEIRRLGASRVVIDSLSGFELALAPTFRNDFRQSLARLVAALTGSGVTLLMTSELEDRFTDLRFSPHGTAFLTDAIIVHRYVELAGRLLRALAVVKLRGSPHSDELRLFHVDDDGLHIDERLAGHTGLLTGRPLRLPAD